MTPLDKHVVLLRRAGPLMTPQPIYLDVTDEGGWTIKMSLADFLAELAQATALAELRAEVVEAVGNPTLLVTRAQVDARLAPLLTAESFARKLAAAADAVRISWQMETPKVL